MNLLLAAVVVAGSGAGLVGILIHILIVALIIGLILWVLTLFPIPAPFGQIARVLVIVIGAVIILLDLVSLL